MASKADMRVPASYPSLELSDIVYTLKPLEDKYYELGVQLGVGIDQLKQIEGEHQGNSRRFSEMIVSWQNKSENCTWSALAKAVDRVGGYDKLVKKMREKDAFSTSTGDVESSEDTGYATAAESHLASDDSSGSEIEHFDKIPGCGCDKPCSLYTLCAGECPNPTSKKVGVVRKRIHGQAVQRESLPEVGAEEEDYAEEFEEQTTQMRVRFAGLMTDICDSFQKGNVTPERVILFLQHAHPLALKPMDEMSKETSLDAVFRMVTCSWFDYKVIKDLICKLGDDNDKKLLDDYEKEYKSFAEQRKLPKGKKHIEVGGAKEGCKKLVIKIDREWAHVNYNDLDRIRSNLASILKVKRSDLYLADVREGCIMMTFMISKELSEKLFRSKLDSNQIKSLRDEGVTLFMCGNFSWRSAAEQRASGITLQPQLGVQQQIGQGDEFHDLAPRIQGEVEEEQKRNGDRETDHEKVEEVDLETPSHTSNRFNPPRIKKSIMRPNDHDQGCTHTDDPEIEEDIAKFERETEKIRQQFARLVNDTRRSLENRGVTTSQFILYLKDAHPLALKPRIGEMRKATCLEQVFAIVTDQACSWFNYEIMKDVVDVLGGDQEKKQMRQYEANFKIFVKQRLPKEKRHIEVGNGARNGGTQLVIKINLEWDEVNFNDLDKIRGNLAKILGVERKNLYLVDIQEGCIMMTFMISKELADGLFPKKSDTYLTTSQIKSLKEEGVILLTCGECVIWQSTSEAELEMSLRHDIHDKGGDPCAVKASADRLKIIGDHQSNVLAAIGARNPSFQRKENGLEVIEHSISELDTMTVSDKKKYVEESEAFVANQEGEGEGESQQEAKKALTSRCYHIIDASFTCSLTIFSRSSRSGFRPVISMDKLSHSLKLFSRFKITPIRLSSVVSASSVHTSPSFSRKYSSNGGYFCDRTHPQSSVSLKISDVTLWYFRTGLLRSSRSCPKYHLMSMPTNRSPGQSAASNGHSSSRIETPVRRICSCCL